MGTWVCDCWKPQLNVPADRFQLCLAHQIRNLQGLIERAPRLQWARERQAQFREAIHLAKRGAELSAHGFARRVTDFLVRVAFTEGTTRDLDLALYRHGPIFEPIRRQAELSRAVHVDADGRGALTWPNGADIDPDVLDHGGPIRLQRPDVSRATSTGRYSQRMVDFYHFTGDCAAGYSKPLLTCLHARL